MNKKQVISEETKFVSVEQSNGPEVSPAAKILHRLQCKKAAAAVNLGITVSEVDTMSFDLSQLETKGIFLNVDCRGFKPLNKSPVTRENLRSI